MAKKAPKKKINRRTKRLIRRSIAAVLMITAIGVAAIPVPDIQADDGSAGVSRADNNEKRDTALVEAAASSTRVRVNYSVTKADFLNTELTVGGILDSSLHPDDDVNGSDIIYGIRQNSDGEWDYNWQFRFYTLDDNRSIVKAYNDQYNEKDVTLHVTNPLRYYTVEVKDFTDFYGAGGVGQRTFTLGYEDYVASKASGDWGTKSDDQDFFSYYYPDKYRTFITECQRKDQDPNRTVGALSGNPARDFNQEQQYQYYCDCNFTSTGSNFIGGRGELTLVYANDYAHRKGAEIPHIYLVRLVSGKTFTGNGKLDDNGFVSENQIQISGIANNAFKGVTTIETLALPAEINYVGDNAFEGSFIESINFSNVAIIGNQAFKNCKRLTSITIGSGVQEIGAEAFSGSPNVTSVTIPYSIRKIGAGAFSYCTGLKTVDMSATSSGNDSGVLVDNYAFFDCYSLDQFIMGNGITEIGDGAFATTNAEVGTQGKWDTVVLPTGINEEKLGQWLFAGRRNLKSVTFPANYGDDKEVKVPDNTFMGCVSLKEVIFPDTCGYVTYDTYLFLDVIEPDLVVSGPEYNDMLGGQTIASPRSATWQAISAVSDYIPYKYTNKRNGLVYYEVSDGTYLLTANQQGVLTSCELVEKDESNIKPFELVIPEYVGNYKIQSIDTNCFSDEVIRKYIQSITISDNSVSEIADGTFRDLPILESVTIGNSVTHIGNSAFEGCKQLVDVTFNSPANGNYAGFTIGTNAFETGSNKLTFHGDIKEGYAPYDWAMNPENYVDSDMGIRVCYKSLSPTNLTVLYDNATGERTLVDYPKYARLDKDNQEFIERMENTYYNRYSGSEYDDRRAAFLADWNAAEDPESAYAGINYGPWINAEWIRTIGNSASGNTQAVTPLAYFEKNPYSIIENYEHPGDYEWQSLTPLAESWVNSALKITVPAGVDSIDVYKYLTTTSNRMNVSTYLHHVIPDEDYFMYDTPKTDADNIDAVPGLFSGYFQDFEDDDEDGKKQEKKIRGNDRIEEIVLESVKYLPDYAFDSCENLKKVTIGPGCKDIGTAPFRGCDNLPEVVFQNNDTYTSNKGIIYSVNEDGTYTIEECLPYRGQDSISAPPLINLANDPDLANVSAIKEGAFEDCNNISAVDLRDTKNLQKIPEKTFKNCKILSQVYLPVSVDLIESEAFAMTMDGEQSRITVTIPGREVHIATDAFQHVPTAMIRSYYDSAAHEYADYHGLAWEDLAETFQVIFMDWDGSIIGEIQYVETDKNATPPEDPVREGYTFIGWSDDYLGITKDTICLAQYRLNGTGGDPNDPNNPNNPNDPNNPNNPNNPGDDIVSDGKSYNVTVVNGSGGGSYLSGSTVRISANTPATGQRFSYWSSSDGVRFADANSATTTFTMPTRNVTVTANYTSSSSNGNGSNGNGSGGNKGNGSSVSGNNNGTGTTVTINRPGFSNTDIASATVNGSTDNFMVRITETAEATRAVEAALTAEYGSLENIRYFAMDITLWDSTGTTKITDTTGITVDITIPLPTDFVNYGGNNKTAGVVNDRLDKLSPKFTTIDGIPCVTFRATHFSPYAIYVDVTNLSDGAMLDSTPKTGDGIHPKWFLAIGLASVSVVLFLKKDKKQAGRRTKLA